MSEEFKKTGGEIYIPIVAAATPATAATDAA
jgi:hypothetical protein